MHPENMTETPTIPIPTATLPTDLESPEEDFSPSILERPTNTNPVILKQIARQW